MYTWGCMTTFRGAVEGCDPTAAGPSGLARCRNVSASAMVAAQIIWEKVSCNHISYQRYHLAHVREVQSFPALMIVRGNLSFSAKLIRLDVKLKFEVQKTKRISDAGMAPFARGKKGGPSSFKNQKNANGFSSTKAPQRNIFNSTRVESPTREISDVEDRDPEESESNVEEASSDVSSGEEEEVKPAVKPYNSLLQALNAGTQRDQPPRKKRKVEILTVLNDAKEEIGNAISSTNKQSDRDIDIVEELEEGGNLVSEDVQDVDELDDEENGKIATLQLNVKTNDKKMSAPIRCTLRLPAKIVSQRVSLMLLRINGLSTRLRMKTATKHFSRFRRIAVSCPEKN